MTAVSQRPSYTSPDVDALDEDHVRAALDFFVAIEPDPPSDTREEYEAAIEPYHRQAAAALATLRRFGEQTWPMTLEQMQEDYYRFTNDPHCLRSAVTSSVVTTVLNQAWHGVGPWRC